MERNEVDIIAKKSGKTSRTVFRALGELELSGKKTLSKELTDLVIIYIRIDGANQIELRRTLKAEIKKLALPVLTQIFDNDFKEYLLGQSKLKDKQIKRKDKRIDKYSDTIVGLTDKMVALLDDLSMLRIQDTGTVQRLYDKNVLADLLADLEPGTAAHNSIGILLDRLNQKN